MVAVEHRLTWIRLNYAINNKANKLAVIYRSVDELIPYVNNSRTHSDEQVTQVAASIKEFGFTNPVLIDDDNGIIAGHGRLMAAKKLGLDDVPTITLTGLSDAQRKAYVIADNKLALNSGWDNDLLRIEIETLEKLDFNIDLLGFDTDELSDLDSFLADDEDEETEPQYDDVLDEQKFLLLIEYDNERQLEKAFDEVQQKGFKCKIIE